MKAPNIGFHNDPLADAVSHYVYCIITIAK